MFAILGSLLLSGPTGPYSECLRNLSDKGDEVITIYSSGGFDVPALTSSTIRLGLDFDIPHKNNFQYTINTYIVDFNHLQELETVVKELSNKQVLNTHQRNVFLTNNTIPIESIIQTLWRYGMAKFILIIRNEIYTWAPNLGGCANFSSAIKLNHCHDVKFPKSITCPIRVRISIWPPFVYPPELNKTKTGLDINLMNTIAEGLKFKVIYTVSELWSENFEEANDSNNFKALQIRNADVLITSIIPTIKRNQFFELSRYYYEASDGFCVPTAIKLPQYYKWFEVTNLCAYASTTLLIFSIISYTFNRIQNKIQYAKLLLHHFGNLTSQAVVKVPRKHNLRLLLITWLIFTLHMNMFYQTKLISVMYKPLYTKQIKTIDDLINSKLHFLFLEHYVRYFKYSSDIRARNILNRIEGCDDIKVCLKNVTIDKNSAVCIQYSSINFYLEKNRDDNGRPLLYCFRDAVNTSPLILVMNRNFYLLEEINRYISYCTESGFIRKWVTEFFTNEKFYEKEVGNQPLQLGNLRIIFYIYVIGITAALIVFMMEIIKG